MPGEASIYDAHVEEVMDLRDGMTSYHVLVTRSLEDGVIDAGERIELEAVYAITDGKARGAITTAERIAAAARLVRSLFYAGHSAWVRRIARETERDLELERGALS
jgi:hypothetical protein